MKSVKNIAIGILLLAAGVYAGKLLFGRSTPIPAPVPAYFSESEVTGDSSVVAPVSGKTIDVKPGGSVQAAVGKANPGGFDTNLSWAVS